MSLNKQVQNALVNSGSSFSFRHFQPKQYKDRQFEYYSDTTRTFIQETAKYASDYVEAEVQGLNPEQPFEYAKVHLRFSNVIKPSGALSNEFDNYKYVQIAERQYDYIRRGAKVISMGNVWLAVNPQNMSDGGLSVLQKCDATWNYLDYYGNIQKEPMAIDRLLRRANTPDSQRSTMITKGYFNARVQYNEATQQLFENSRIILGSSAYILTGFSDFQQEFTGDDDSVNMMEFTLRYDEPNGAIDDMVNHVAGGKTFHWDINIGGESTLTVGETQPYTASSIRTNAGETNTVVSTDEFPIAYTWKSSNEEVATVDESGNVTAIGEGEATITCTLVQNESITQDFNITVAGIDMEPHVAFTGTYPENLPYRRSVTFNAVYYENGEVTEEPVEWSISGADPESYTFKVSEEDPNTAILTCWGGNVEPAVITATYGTYSASHTLYLMGI